MLQTVVGGVIYGFDNYSSKVIIFSFFEQKVIEGNPASDIAKPCEWGWP